MEKFNYENRETKIQKGGKLVRKVSIKNGKGYKSITKYHRGKKIYTAKKPIHKKHIYLIKKGKFIPGLFSDIKTKKRRGGVKDIEMGPEPTTTYMKNIPPNPDRFKVYEKRERLRPISPQEAEIIFAKPPPEKREKIENVEMASEDPLNKDPFEVEELQIFRG
jgi:hypothetical protein